MAQLHNHIRQYGIDPKRLAEYAAEIKQIKTLAEDYSPVNRIYQLSIYDEAGVRIAEVEKTVYIRRKKAKPDLK